MSGCPWLLASVGDPRDIATWSGTPYHLLHELSKARSVTTIDISPPVLGELALKGVQWGWNLTGGARYSREREPIRLRWMANDLASAIETTRPELVLVLSGLPVSRLPNLDVPVVVWSDATFCALTDYYPGFSRLSDRPRRNGHAEEAAALARADLTLLSSSWAADFAITHYIESGPIKVLPFGANLLSPPPANSRWISPNGTCIVLTVGYEYIRKGLDRVVDAASHAEVRGIPVEVHIVGSKRPAGRPLPKNVVWHGRLRKHREGKFDELFRHAHVFTLLSRADCTPMVVSEALAYGLPIVASSTGGLPEMVAGAGLLMQDSATAGDIVQAWRKAAEMRASGLGAAARQQYETTYNWNTAVGRLLDETATLL